MTAFRAPGANIRVIEDDEETAASVLAGPLAARGYRVVGVHDGQLRRRLDAADPGRGLRDLIVTEPGVGYRLRAEDAPDL